MVLQLNTSKAVKGSVKVIPYPPFCSCWLLRLWECFFLRLSNVAFWRGLEWEMKIEWCLQFADDTLVFCRNVSNQLRILRCTIRCFELVSGLQVNFSKSRIYGVGHVPNLRSLVDILGCQIDSIPSYLGLWGHLSRERRFRTRLFLESKKDLLVEKDSIFLKAGRSLSWSRFWWIYPLIIYLFLLSHFRLLMRLKNFKENSFG